MTIATYGFLEQFHLRDDYSAMQKKKKKKKKEKEEK